MTLDECRKYLPKGWAEPIQNDPILWECFSQQEYDLEQEAVPPFLMQDLRGGNIERLRPILSLYGQPGLDMLQGLLEIDAATRDTAERTLPDGQIAYAGYFFARFSPDTAESAIHAAKRYIRAIRQIYTKLLEEPAPISAEPNIQILTGQEGQAFNQQIQNQQIQGRYNPGDDVYSDLGDWFSELDFQENCGELSHLLHESLYHISCDYFLSYYLQWPLLASQGIENPFRPYFELWKMGLHINFPEKDRVVLIGN